MVSDEGLQRKIAELLGWTDVVEVRGRWYGVPLGDPHKGTREEMPRWARNRDASYELPVEDFERYGNCHGVVFIRIEKPGSVLFPMRASAYIESLAWVEYKGWRWVDCDSCGGTGAGIGPDGEPDYCAKCYPGTEGGEWVHDS